MKDNSKINIIIYIFLISSVCALNRHYNLLLKELISKAKSKNLSIENEKPKIEDYDLIYEEKSEFLNSGINMPDSNHNLWKLKKMENL